MIKKLLVKLYYRTKSLWRRFQAADLSVELDHWLRQRKQRARYLAAIGAQRLIYTPQPVTVAERRRRQQYRFWLPFSIVAVSLLFYPITPLLRYALTNAQTDLPTPANAQGGLTDYEQSLDQLINDNAAHLPIANDQVDAIAFTPRVIIEKIGVDAKIVEGDNARRALNQGIWRMPIGSTPDRGGNTILTAHRYKFLPPNTNTFYLLDKLAVGDRIDVQWQGKQFTYQVKETKVVTPQTVEILANTKEPQLTLFTCTPLFTSTNRLVVIAALIDIR